MLIDNCEDRQPQPGAIGQSRDEKAVAVLSVPALAVRPVAMAAQPSGPVETCSGRRPFVKAEIAWTGEPSFSPRF